MVEEWSWEFLGYLSATGAKPVQDWWNSDLSEDAKDDAKDKLGYLQIVPNHQWRRPTFDQLQDGISEIRFDDAAGTYRLFGFFGPRRRQYTFLLGLMKKGQTNREKKIALARMREIERGEAKTHGFEF